MRTTLCTLGLNFFDNFSVRLYLVFLGLSYTKPELMSKSTSRHRYGRFLHLSLLIDVITKNVLKSFNLCFVSLDAHFVLFSFAGVKA